MVFQEHNHPGQMGERNNWQHVVQPPGGKEGRAETVYSPCVTEAALGSEAAP